MSKMNKKKLTKNEKKTRYAFANLFLPIRTKKQFFSEKYKIHHNKK